MLEGPQHGQGCGFRGVGMLHVWEEAEAGLHILTSSPKRGIDDDQSARLGSR